MCEDGKKDSSLSKPRRQNRNAKLYKEIVVAEILDIILRLTSRETTRFRSLDLQLLQVEWGKGRTYCGESVKLFLSSCPI
jgi:hypothetical protein